MIFYKEYTPEEITELKPNEVFVFGSNLAGVPSDGAAQLALERFGATWGQGVGLQGQSYAIPTKQGGVETIKPYVDEFIDFARRNKNYKFLVTRLGCGFFGFKDKEIAPLFARAFLLDNVVLPKEFVMVMHKEIPLWETWHSEYIFESEDNATMNSLPSQKEKDEFMSKLISGKRYKLSDKQVILPSGKFIKRDDTLIGFEPAFDNIIPNRPDHAQTEDGGMTLKHLVFPCEGFANISDGLFENITVVGKVELPPHLESIGGTSEYGSFRNCVFSTLEIPSEVSLLGNYVFDKCKIGSLTIYPDALKSKYGRQFKESSINTLYLPKNDLPLRVSQLGVLHSIIKNAEVNEVYFGDSVHMSWDDFLKEDYLI